MKQPHLIMIVADQLRWDVLGRGYTPNIDSIAAGKWKGLPGLF